MTNKRIMWSGYEFDYTEKSTDWYWAVGIITISIAAASSIYGNYLFAVFIVIAGAFVMFTANKPPRFNDYELTEKGLLINGNLKPHIEFKAFWISESPYAAPRLFLQTNKIANPILIIPIETDYVDSAVIRDFLLDYVPEEQINEPLATKLMELLGL